MAQAARLSSRMQKELKLLLTDPPPGASFPILSDDCSISSLTSIDALFEGPQGTVYSNGVFKIRIQIPERYPFQPPVVTFATPIYHPNIDTGGRICLDILNLPPKGTWQPSLNISTVLTSIGLLLSEPNPDDGLMQEASKEYKYNRQAFDQIARSMTEKYARVGGSESSVGSHVSQTRPGPSTAQTETERSDASPCAEGFKIRCNKLSLKSLQSSSHSNSEKEVLKEANSSSTTKYNENLGRSQTTRNKLSLVVSRSRNGISLPSQFSSMLDTKTTSNDPPESLPSVGVIVNQLSNINEDYIERSSKISVPIEQKSLHFVKMSQSGDPDKKLQSVSIRTSHKRVAIAGEGSCSASGVLKKVGPVREIPNLGSFGCPRSYSEDEKENMTLVQQTNQSAANGMHSNERRRLVPQKGTHKPLKTVDQLLVISHSENPSSPLSEFLHVKNDVSSNEKQQIKQAYDGESTDKFQQLTEEGPCISENVIVLDSEDEDLPVRSKLLLPKRCLSRKRKGNLSSYR